jgi:hypothetical protein
MLLEDWRDLAAKELFAGWRGGDEKLPCDCH